MGIVKSFPTGRKTAQNFLDKTPGLGFRLGGWKEGLRCQVSGVRCSVPGTHDGGFRLQDSTWKTSNREGIPLSHKVPRGGEVRHQQKKMLINDVRSRNVYENKQKDDNFTGEKSDISTQRNGILRKITPILLKLSGFCHNWSARERIPRLRMSKLEAAALSRHAAR